MHSLKIFNSISFQLHPMGFSLKHLWQYLFYLFQGFFLKKNENIFCIKPHLTLLFIHVYTSAWTSSNKKKYSITLVSFNTFKMLVNFHIQRNLGMSDASMLLFYSIFLNILCHRRKRGRYRLDGFLRMGGVKYQKETI